MPSTRSLAAGLVALALSTAAAAQNLVIHHSGRLLNTDDTPVSGNVTLTLSVHESPTGGDALFTDTFQLTVFQGVYSIAVGDTSVEGRKPLPASAFDGSARYLSVKIDNVELEPRLLLGAAPFAAVAEIARVADKALDLDCVACVTPEALSFDPTPADGSVTTAKLANGAVTAAQLGLGAVGTDKLLEGAVTTSKLAAGAVQGDRIANGTVGTAHLADASVNGAKLAAGAVGAAHIDDGSIGTAKLAAGAVSTEKLSEGAVSAEKIATGAITREKLAPGAVSTSPVRASYIFEEGSGQTVADQSSLGHDLTVPGSGMAWIDDGQRGKAVQFLGSGSYLQAPSSDSLRITDEITLEAWVYLMDGTGLRAVVGKANSYLMGINNNLLQTAIHTGSGWSWQGAGYVPLNTWTHVAITYDGFALRTYVNQVLTSVTPWANGPITANDNPITIGGRSDANEPFNGRIDNVKVHAVAKTFQQPSFVGAYERARGAVGELTTKEQWIEVANPKVSYTKKSPTSVLKIDFSDTMRAGLTHIGHMFGEITLDGNNGFPGGDDNRCYWRIHQYVATYYQDYHQPVHITCYVRNIPAGPHVFGLRYYLTAGSGHFGWERSQRTLSVEEIFSF